MKKWIACIGTAFLATASAHACGEMPDDLDFGKLRSWVVRCRPTTVADVVKNLPPRYKTNATFVYESHSKSEVDHPGTITSAYPRPILFGNRNFILTFTGQPGTPSYQEIETVEYKPDNRSFEFKVIRIAPNGGSTFDEKPTSCASCHGEKPRPIWKDYPSWPGAYGSERDSLSLGRESENFRMFSDAHSSDRRDVANDGRYRALDTKELPLKARFPGRRPNEQLGTIFAQMVAHSFAGEIERSPDFQDLFPLMLAEKVGCANLSSVHSEAYRKRFERAPHYDSDLVSPFGSIPNLLARYMPKSFPKEWVNYNPTGEGELLPSAVINWIIADTLKLKAPFSNYFTEIPSNYDPDDLSAHNHGISNFPGLYGRPGSAAFCADLEKKIKRNSHTR